MYVCACDFMGLLMCAMSVQDILVKKPDGGTKLIPMYQIVKTIVCILFVS